MAIKKGMKGESVKILQNILGIPADGDFGRNTEKAVRAYQKSKGLFPDGIAGNSTLISLGISLDTNVKIYTSKEIIKRVYSLNDFKTIPEGYWIVGIRNPNDATDKFDDMFYLMNNGEIVMKTTGTTNPGASILKGGFKKYNSDGAAVVESDRIYYDVWKYGMHNGYMPALKQLGAKITVWRDGDMDGKSEEQGKKFSGYYGINFHTATKSYLGKVIKTLIGGWSAGCQVCNNSEEYMEIINKIKTSGQEKITYCLLKEF